MEKQLSDKELTELQRFVLDARSLREAYGRVEREFNKNDYIKPNYTVGTYLEAIDILLDGLRGDKYYKSSNFGDGGDMNDTQKDNIIEDLRRVTRTGNLRYATAMVMANDFPENVRGFIEDKNWGVE